jgi:hypothetical protein
MGCLALIRLVDKVPPSHPQHDKLFQAGDVICVIPDTGWGLGVLTMQDPEVAYIHLEDMEQSEAELEFMAPDPGDDPNLKRRAAQIDRALLPPQALARLNSHRGIDRKKGNGEDKEPAEMEAEYRAAMAQCNRVDALAARRVKPAAANPFSIGRSPFEVG